MKKPQLIFLLVVALAIALGAFVVDGIELEDGMVLSRADVWRLGFGPACVVLSAILSVTALLAYRGSAAALRLCAAWAAIYSMVNGGLVVWHLSRLSEGAVLLIIAWSVAWYLSIRRWKVGGGV